MSSRWLLAAAAAISAFAASAPSASAANISACSAAAAQPLALDQLVDLTPGCEEYYATVPVRLGDRLTLRAAGGTGGIHVGFVVPDAVVTWPPSPPYEDDWTDCQLPSIGAGQGDEISCLAARRDTLLLQVSSHGASGQAGVWVAHARQRNHTIAGQCDFLACAPVMRLYSVQIANTQWGCEGADDQFPVYQRWRVNIDRPRVMTLTIRRGTPGSRLDLEYSDESLWLVKPHTDPADYRQPRREVCTVALGLADAPAPPACSATTAPTPSTPPSHLTWCPCGCTDPTSENDGLHWPRRAGGCARGARSS